MELLSEVKTLEDALNWRYATKKFDAERKLDEAILDMLLEAARMAPTSYGLQPFSITVIQDDELRGKIHSQASGQPQIVEASDLIVFSVDETLGEDQVDRYIEKIASIRNTAVDKLEPFSTTIKGTLASLSDTQKQNWAARQAYIALGFLLQAAALYGVDACPMEGFNKEKLRPLLPGHDNLVPVVMVTLGYRSEEDGFAEKAKVRKDKNEMIRFI